MGGKKANKDFSHGGCFSRFTLELSTLSVLPFHDDRFHHQLVVLVPTSHVQNGAFLRPQPTNFPSFPSGGPYKMAHQFSKITARKLNKPYLSHPQKSMTSMNRSLSRVLCLIFLSGLVYFERVKVVSCYEKYLNARCRGFERRALVKFKDHLTDPSGRLSSWVGDDCCAWRGVICNNSTGHVISLNLRNAISDSDEMVYELGGEIDSSLLNLKYLEHLDLSMNYFGGIPIPSFLGSFTKLTYLNLSSASFGGTVPSSLGNLSSLRCLDLHSYTYELSANDLQWVSTLSSLSYLNLGGVDLSKAASYWLQVVNKLTSLLELHLPQCQLSDLPVSLPMVNFTSLSVVDLSNNGFNSTIPSWLFYLSSLTYLDLNSNNLQGGLPDAFSKLTSLKKLDLSENSFLEGQLSGSLGRLCNLRLLELSVNNFTGKLTDFIDGLSKCSNTSRLETLDLRYNELGGNLPGSLGYLKNLRRLQLGQNAFRGSIPSSIGNLSSLEELDLSYNQMGGSITTNLGQLSSLSVLDLSENLWEGVITEAHFTNLSSLKELSMKKDSPNISVVFYINPAWTPPFKLRYINIRSCQLGPKFPRWLRNQNELITLVLNNARISDTLPDWFWKLDLQVNELDVAYNKLRGKVPNSLKFPPLSTVDLSSNLFQGPLPLWSPNVSALYLRDNLFSGPIPSDIGEMMPHLTDLDISRNLLNGSIPLSLGNMSNMTNLAMSYNHLTGEIPDFWSGFPYLYFLDMANNNLSGTIPSSVGNINFLKFLILSGNNLSGEVPPALQNCTTMDTLDLGDNRLSGNLPAWIADSMPTLLILRVRNNFLTGVVPSQICGLSNLHILDLSQNRFSGPIPSCMGNLTGLKTELKLDSQRYEGRLQVMTKGRMLDYAASTLYLVNTLDLSSNNLSGDIPEGITSLVRLGTLNLSANHLTGHIPEQIANLERLETLDLSKNKLSGPIPASMASLTFLNHLNLSYNNLSGKIPTSNQFQSLDNPSIYKGNPALCGIPLENKCTDNDDNKTTPDAEDSDGDSRTETFWFAVSTGLGFIVGFWGVCGTLVLKKAWRTAYFRFVEKTHDRLILAVSRIVIYLRRKFSRD